MKIKYLVGALCLLVSSFSFAFQTKITDTYSFGDGDSTASVREVLLERIKRDAANQAGSYIQSDKTVDSRGYRESIRTISASIVKLKILSEKTGVNKSGSFYLRIVANANIDEKELKKRIAAIQSDKSKDRVIKSLSKEKEALLRKMAKLEKALKNKALTSQRVSEILADQSEITRQLSANDSAVSKVFKRGTLISLASKSKGRSTEVVARFKKDYQRFWEKQSRALDPEIVSVEESSKYSGYDVTVKVPINSRMYDEMKKMISGLRLKTRGPLVADDSSLRDLKNKKVKTDILSRLGYINQSGYKSLFIKVGNKTKKIEFFGFFRKGFFSRDPYSVDKKASFTEFKNAANDIGYSSNLFAFINKHPYKSDWIIKDGTVIIKMYLSAKEAQAADKVVAYFK